MRLGNLRPGNSCKMDSHPADKSVGFLLRVVPRLAVCWILSFAALMAQDATRVEMTREKVRQLDAALANEVRRSSQPVDDAAIQAYVERVGRRLGAGSDVPWAFEVIASEAGGATREPISLPGGHIFVSAHLLAAVENEAEFAGMLAHAMGHVVSGQVAVRPPGGRTIPLIFMGGWNGLGAGDERGMAMALPLSMIDARRKWEVEADRAAVPMTVRAGFDPTALSRYVGRTQRDADPKFAVLPPREQRVAEIERLSAGLEVRAESPGGDFAAAQERARALIALSAQTVKREPPTLRRPGER